jgi:hypothetical protein
MLSYKILTEFQLADLLTQLEKAKRPRPQKGVRLRSRVGVTSVLRRGVWTCVGWNASMDLIYKYGVRVRGQSQPRTRAEDPDYSKCCGISVESFLGETAHLQVPLSRGRALSKYLTTFHWHL